MLGTYASAALICAASMLVGRAVLTLAGRRAWSWLEPAVGFARDHHRHRPARAGGRARDHGDAGRGRCWSSAPRSICLRGSATSARGALRAGLPVAIAIAPRLRDPLRGQRPLGADRGRLQQRPRPAPRLGGVAAQRLRARPLKPATRSARTGWRSRSRRCPGISLGQAFLGEIFAIGVLTGLTALAALCASSARRAGCSRRSLVALTYLAASYFAQGAFKETAEALFVLALGAGAARPGARRRRAAGRGCACSLPYLALAGGVFFSYSFAGLAWPVAIVAPLGPDPARGAPRAGAAGAAARPLAAADAARRSSPSPASASSP